MDFTLNEDQSALKDGAERFVSDLYGFEDRRRRIEMLSETDREMWQRFAEMGWLAIMVPEEQGGLGWDMPDMTVLLQVFGGALIAEPLLEGAVIAVSILRDSDMAMPQSLLEQIASGEKIILPALLEKKGRYAYSNPSTEAEKVDSGYQITGKKILVQGGDIADAFIVSAMVDNEVNLFLVNADAPGLSRNAYRLLDGSYAVDVEFDCLLLEQDALIGGQEALDVALDYASIGIAAQQSGSLTKLLDLTAEYLSTRQQFGQPLANFQALQHAMADCHIDSEIAKSLIFAALADFDVLLADRQKAVSAMRVRMNRAAVNGANKGIHLHGGMGMTMEYPVGHHYRRMLQLAACYGDSDYHLQRYEGHAFKEI